MKPITINEVRLIALSFEGAVEVPHFEMPSFRIGKKIFATFNIQENRVCLKLPEIEQSVFSAFNKAVAYPVPNAWGKQGWTLFNLKNTRRSMLKDAMTVAYQNVRSAKLKIKKGNQPFAGRDDN